MCVNEIDIYSAIISKRSTSQFVSFVSMTMILQSVFAVLTLLLLFTTNTFCRCSRATEAPFAGYLSRSEINLRYLNGLNHSEEHDIADERDVEGWERGKSRNVSIYIKPNENTALNQPYTTCKDFKNRPLLIIFVFSAVENIKQR